jgi:hypothetical protein
MSFAFASRLLPGRAREGYRKLLVYSSFTARPEKYMGFALLSGFVIAFAVSLSAALLLKLSIHMSLLAFPVSYLVFELCAYMLVWFSAESKGKATESVLPDALQLMSMNIRAGMTTDRAILLSARPEFGPLEQELRAAGKEILAGKDIGKALLEIPGRVKSDIVESTVKLIVEGIGSGGEIAKLLEQTASDIQKTKLLEKEVRANVLMYVMFIFFAAGIGAPLVFGISTHLVDTLTEQMSQFRFAEIGEARPGVSPFGSFKSFTSITNISINPDFLIMYAVLCLAVTSIFGGIIIGLIKDGKEKEGAKYIPILLLLSIAIFFATRMLIASMLSF